MQKIIDSHVHLGKTEKCLVYQDWDSYWAFMTVNQIQGAVVMPNISSIVKSSRLNRDFIKGYGDNMYRCLLADPTDSLTISQIQDYEISGVKYHPSCTQIPSDDPCMDAFWRICTQKKYFAIIHCGRSRKSRIESVINTANKWPDVIFIAAHLGGGATDIVEEALKQKIPENVYMDISAMKVPRLIEMAVETVGTERLLFGSDIPYADFHVTKYVLSLANIDNKDDIYYKNMEKILEVSDNL